MPIKYEFGILESIKPKDSSNPEVLAEFKFLLPEVFRVADERNRYIHEPWDFDRSLTSSGKIRRIKMTYQGIEDGDTVVSIEGLNLFCRDIIAVQDEIVSIHEKLRPRS